MTEKQRHLVANNRKQNKMHPFITIRVSTFSKMRIYKGTSKNIHNFGDSFNAIQIEDSIMSARFASTF